MRPEQAFGAWVKDLRQTRGWTQEEFSKRMTAAGHPMHQTAIARLERGSRPTNVGELGAIAMIFQTSIAALLDPSDDDRMHQHLMGLADKLAEISNEKNRIEGRLAELETERFVIEAWSK